MHGKALLSICKGLCPFSSYTAPEGVPIKLSFTSGVGGYQPVGDHLPVAPTPVPLPYERNDY